MHHGLGSSSIMGHGQAFVLNRCSQQELELPFLLFFYDTFSCYGEVALKLFSCHGNHPLVLIFDPFCACWTGLCCQSHFHDWFHHLGTDDSICCYYAETSWMGWLVDLSMPIMPLFSQTCRMCLGLLFSQGMTTFFLLAHFCSIEQLLMWFISFILFWLFSFRALAKHDIGECWMYLVQSFWSKRSWNCGKEVSL